MKKIALKEKIVLKKNNNVSGAGTAGTSVDHGALDLITRAEMKTARSSERHKRHTAKVSKKVQGMNSASEPDVTDLSAILGFAQQECHKDPGGSTETVSEPDLGECSRGDLANATDLHDPQGIVQKVGEKIATDYEDQIQCAPNQNTQTEPDVYALLDAPDLVVQAGEELDAYHKRLLKTADGYESQGANARLVATVHKIRFGISLLDTRPDKNHGRAMWQKKTAHSYDMESRNLGIILATAEVVRDAKRSAIKLPIGCLRRPMQDIPCSIESYLRCGDLDAAKPKKTLTLTPAQSNAQHVVRMKAAVEREIAAGASPKALIELKVWLGDRIAHPSLKKVPMKKRKILGKGAVIGVKSTHSNAAVARDVVPTRTSSKLGKAHVVRPFHEDAPRDDDGDKQTVCASASADAGDTRTAVLDDTDAVGTVQAVDPAVTQLDLPVIPAVVTAAAPKATVKICSSIANSTEQKALRFGDVTGNAKAVMLLSRRAAMRWSKPILIGGPAGSGKTSLGLIYGRSVLCGAVRDKNYEPCGKCESCLTEPIIVDLAEDCVEEVLAANALRDADSAEAMKRAPIIVQMGDVTLNGHLKSFMDLAKRLSTPLIFTTTLLAGNKELSATCTIVETELVAEGVPWRDACKTTEYADYRPSTRKLKTRFANFDRA